VASVEDFMQRQRAASARIGAGLGRIAQIKDDFTRTALPSVGAVVSAPGDEAGRAREAVRLIGPSIEAIERALEAETPGIMAAVAELSENSQEHERIWDDLGPEDLQVAIEGERSISGHSGGARERARERSDVQGIAQELLGAGEEPAAATRPVLSPLEGMMATLDEHPEPGGRFAAHDSGDRPSPTWLSQLPAALLPTFHPTQLI
jgi:hypothetical protein